VINQIIMFKVRTLMCITVRVKSDSLEWAAAVTSLLRRLYELSSWQPVITNRLSRHIAAVTVRSVKVFHLVLFPIHFNCSVKYC